MHRRSYAREIELVIEALERERDALRWGQATNLREWEEERRRLERERDALQKRVRELEFEPVTQTPTDPETPNTGRVTEEELERWTAVGQHAVRVGSTMELDGPDALRLIQRVRELEDQTEFLRLAVSTAAETAIARERDGLLLRVRELERDAALVAAPDPLRAAVDAHDAETFARIAHERGREIDRLRAEWKEMNDELGRRIRERDEARRARDAAQADASFRADAIAALRRQLEMERRVTEQTLCACTTTELEAGHSAVCVVPEVWEAVSAARALHTARGEGDTES